MNRLDLKKLIVSSLNLEGVDPEKIVDDAPLFSAGGSAGLGLDSVDALELVVALEKACGIKIQSNEVGRDTFASVASLSAFLDAKLSARDAVSGGGERV